MIRRLLSVLVLVICGTAAFAQIDLKKLLQERKAPDRRFIQLNATQQVPFNYLHARTILGLDPHSDLVLANSDTSSPGKIHYRYRQTFHGIPVENAMYIAHTDGGRLKSLNGAVVTNFGTKMDGQMKPSVTFKKALSIALNYVHAEKYAWEDSIYQAHIKFRNGDKATYYPSEEKTWYSSDDSVDPDKLRLAYKIDVYSVKPLDRNFIYVDAQTGKILGTRLQMMNFDAIGKGNTRYSDTVIIHSDSVSPAIYRLRDYTKGNGVITLHSDSAHSDFISSSRNWSLSGQDQAAMDVHYGVAATWVFYNNAFRRNSIDNRGYALVSWVNDPSVPDNARWDGSEMLFGRRTNATKDAVAAIDITGHELTHGVTQHTSGLIYGKESGAINESLSDIMGKSVQFYTKPSDMSWVVGNDMGWLLRDMSNPNAHNQPDTYKGTLWYDVSSCSANGNNDFCGVHTNSGVGNYMFYLLVGGGNGTNDIGNRYCVTGIGLAKAYQIIYRSNTAYLTSGATYEDWRMACINAATDLYGASSNEVRQVKNAWFAVGVGRKEGVDVEFVIDDTGSMSEEIEGVKNSIIRVLNSPKFSSASGCGLVYQLTTFKDNVTIRTSTTDLNVIKSQVSALVASGGDDCPEGSVEALAAVTDSVTEGGLIFLATDASPHAGVDIEGIKNGLKAKNIRVFTVLSGDCSGASAAASLKATQKDEGSSPPYSDNHDTTRTVQKSVAAAALPSSLTAIQAFSYISTETGGIFAYVPEVNTGAAADRTRYENTAFNIILGAVLPAITSIQPSKAPVGATLAVTINGSNTNFNGSTTLSFKDTGIHVTGIATLSPIKITASITIAPSVSLGFKDITATTPLSEGVVETADGIGVLEITSAPTGPTILSISPATGQEGQVLTIVVTGINTNFNATSILNLGSGITIDSIRALSAVELQAHIHITPSAIPGFRDVTVTTGKEIAAESVPGPFLITGAECITPEMKDLGQVCMGTPAIDLSKLVSPSGGTFSGTGVLDSIFNPASLAAGTYDITYTYATGTGCSNTVTKPITVLSLPTADIDTSSIEAFCNKLLLTAHPAAGYEWKYNNKLIDSAQSLTLDLTAKDGAYQLYVTDANGCRSASPAMYNYASQHVFSNYTLVAMRSAAFNRYNNVQTGSVGVLKSNGRIDFEKFCSVAAPGAFVKARYISIDNPSNIPIQISAPATIVLPKFEYNTTSVNRLPAYEVKPYKTVTLTGNYRSLVIGRDANVTLAGTIFGTIIIEGRATVRFTKPAINITGLFVQKGTPGNYTTVAFATDAKVMVRQQVRLEEMTRLNEDGKKVTFYVDNGPCSEERFMVKANDVKFTANVYIPDGKLKIVGSNNFRCGGFSRSSIMTYMRGIFIAEELESEGINVTWNNNNCAPNASSAAIAEETLTSPPDQTADAAADEMAGHLIVTATPNPSGAVFRITITGNNRQEATVRLFDTYGKTLELVKGIQPGTTVTVGTAVRTAGIYYAEVIQGTERKILKLIRIN